MKPHRVWLPVRLAAVLLANILLGVVLLLVVYALPTETIAENVRACISTLNGE